MTRRTIKRSGLPRIVTIDFETHRVGPGYQVPHVVSQAACEGEDGEPFLMRGGVARAYSERLLGGDALVVGSNLPFELATMWVRQGLRLPMFGMLARGRGRCTETREKLIRIHRGERFYRVGLAPLVRDYSGEEIEKNEGWRLRYQLLRDVPLTPRSVEGPCPWEDFEDAPPTSWYFDVDGEVWAPKRRLDRWPREAAAYGLADVEYSRYVFHEQEDLYLAMTGRDRDEGIVDEAPQVVAKFCLHLMRSRGILTDQARARRIIAEFRHHRGLAWDELVRHGLGRSSGSKNEKAMRALMVEVLGDDAPMSAGGKKPRKDGTVSLPQPKIDGRSRLLADVKLASQGLSNPALNAWGTHSRLDTFEKIFVAPLDVAFGVRVHWRFNELVDTGRTSSGKSGYAELCERAGLIFVSTGSNIQNQPTPRAMEDLGRQVAATSWVDRGHEVLDDDTVLVGRQVVLAAPGRTWAPFEKHEECSGRGCPGCASTGRGAPSPIVFTREGEAMTPDRWAAEHDVRGCVVPGEGRIFLDDDWGQVELCALACIQDAIRHEVGLDGPSAMTTLINAGMDLHVYLASRILEISYEEAVEWKEGGHGPAKKRLIKRYRQMAKAANFGFPGGMGDEKFLVYARDGWGVTLSVEQVGDLKSAWLAAYPEMELYFEYISQRYREGICQLVSRRIRRGLRYTSACNTYFQGLAADGAKFALWLLTLASYLTPKEVEAIGIRYVLTDFPGREETERVFRPAGYLHAADAKPLLFIHDQNVLEARDPDPDFELRPDGWDVVRRGSRFAARGTKGDEGYFRDEREALGYLSEVRLNEVAAEAARCSGCRKGYVQLDERRAPCPACGASGVATWDDLEARRGEYHETVLGIAEMARIMIDAMRHYMPGVRIKDDRQLMRRWKK